LAVVDVEQTAYRLRPTNRAGDGPIDIVIQTDLPLMTIRPNVICTAASLLGQEDDTFDQLVEVCSSVALPPGDMVELAKKLHVTGTKSKFRLAHDSMKDAIRAGGLPGWKLVEVKNLVSGGVRIVPVRLGPGLKTRISTALTAALGVDEVTTLEILLPDDADQANTTAAEAALSEIVAGQHAILAACLRRAWQDVEFVKIFGKIEQFVANQAQVGQPPPLIEAA
jgi:hypothetical protein